MYDTTTSTTLKGVEEWRDYLNRNYYKSISNKASPPPCLFYNAPAKEIQERLDTCKEKRAAPSFTWKGEAVVIIKSNWSVRRV
jgi:hypothetical protein